MKKPIARSVKYVVITAIATIVAIQFIPYGKSQTNPPITREPSWTIPETRALAKRACFDCHSNETTWPWYSRVAPVSWLIQRDVESGRKALNFSEWGTGIREGENPKKIKEELVEGEMPPIQYTIMHTDARLTKEEQQQLADELATTSMQLRH